MKTLALMLMSTLPLTSLAQEIAVVPRPAQMETHQGVFALAKDAVIRYSEGAKAEAEMFAGYLRNPAGLPLGVEPLASKATHAIDYILDSSAEDLGNEGYRLVVTPDGIHATARRPAGLFYATQTILQLLPPAAYSTKRATGVKWEIPCVSITDVPRFPWRGMHLDVSRHFFPAPFIKRYIDLMAMHKMNVFHWHILDQGGWRMESKKYPLLTSRGAWRSSPQKGHWDYGSIRFPEKRTGNEYGGFYSQDEIRDIVAYAAQRHVTIVPEIEMPGHSLPAMVCYPYLGCDKADGSGTIISDQYCPGKETTFQFLEDVLAETLDLFPSYFIHIGGDEVDKSGWNQCPQCRKRMQDEGLKNSEELQSYFVRRIEKWLNDHGRALIGWDEILQGGLAPNATVMSWRGEDGGIAAANQSKDVVMTPGSPCYFDWPYTSTSVEQVYAWDPVPKALYNFQAHHILGAQGNVWTEWMPTEQRVEQMAYPRAVAMAEITWSPREGKDLHDFQRRLGVDLQRLDMLGVNYNLPAPSIPCSTILFQGSTTVSLDPLPGMDLRYTADGSEPTTSSAKYTGPIEVTTNATIKAALFHPGGSRGDVTTVSCIAYQPGSAGELQPGLLAGYYEGTWSKLPDWTGMDPVKTETVTAIDTGIRQREENYAIRFRGYLTVGTDAVYQLTLGSDDGAKLMLAGAVVLDNDGTHPYTEKTTHVSLKAGSYPIEIGYFQAREVGRLSLQIEGPGLPKQPVPASLFSHSASR